jgi:hypothetical protein
MGLSFLTPLLLGGAALVAVPIVLHLVMRRAPVPHDFPALRFLQERRIANRRRLRLNHLLLLLLRMAAIIFLALALARPTLRAAGWLGQAEGPVAVAFVFDTSPRMLLRTANRTRLEEAAAIARELLGRLPKGSEVAVVDTAGGPPAFAASPAAALAAIDRLMVAPPTRPLAAAVASSAELLEEASHARRELYLFSDLSRAAWEGGEPFVSVLSRHEGIAPVVVDVGVESPVNFALDTVRLPAERVSATAPLQITVERSRMGGPRERGVAVEILQPDGSYARRAVQPAAWADEGCEPLVFSIAGLAKGTQQGRVVIDGADDLDADNTRFFSVTVDTAPRVLLVAPSPAERTGRFVAEAIAPEALMRDGREGLSCRVVSFEEFLDTAWDDFDGIVMVDPPPLDPATWAQLGDWVGFGRGLVVWLGPQAGTPDAFNSDESRRTLGGSLVRIWRDESGENHLTTRSLDHPMLAVFRRVADTVPWQDFPVYRHWEFAVNPTADEDAGRPPAARPVTPAMPLVSYRDGTPAVLEHPLGQGTVVIVTTPASQAADDPETWNLLATGFEPWPFVVLANESLLHAMNTREDLNVTAGRPAVVRVPADLDAQVIVQSPADDEFPAAVDPQRRTLTVSATQMPGNYRILSGGQRDGFRAGFSVNLPAADTDCRRLDAAAAGELFGVDTPIARTGAEIVREVTLERVGMELAGWLIILAALVMAGDWIVANRFYAPRDDAEPVARPSEGFAEVRSDPPPGPAGPIASRGRQAEPVYASDIDDD